MWPAPVLPADALHTVEEAVAKAALAEHGMDTPRTVLCAVQDAAEAAARFDGLLAVKGTGLAHKSEADAVRLGVPVAEAAAAAQAVRTSTVLIGRRRVAAMLAGYRGQSAASEDAIISAVLALQDYVGAHRDRVQEVEVNPLLCTPTRAVAVDALLRTLTEA